MLPLGNLIVDAEKVTDLIIHVEEVIDVVGAAIVVFGVTMDRPNQPDLFAVVGKEEKTNLQYHELRHE
jgi:hypothetical protein